MQMRNENVYAVGAVVQPGESKDLISPLCKGCRVQILHKTSA